ncbi:unnamed protein product [Arctogadus glacialis]
MKTRFKMLYRQSCWTTCGEEHGLNTEKAIRNVVERRPPDQQSGPVQRVPVQSLFIFFPSSSSCWTTWARSTAMNRVQGSHCVLIFESKLMLLEHLGKDHDLDVDQAIRNATLPPPGGAQPSPKPPEEVATERRHVCAAAGGERAEQDTGHVEYGSSERTKVPVLNRYLKKTHLLQIHLTLLSAPCGRHWCSLAASDPPTPILSGQKTQLGAEHESSGTAPLAARLRPLHEAPVKKESCAGGGAPGGPDDGLETEATVQPRRQKNCTWQGLKIHYGMKHFEEWKSQPALFEEEAALRAAGRRGTWSSSARAAKYALTKQLLSKYQGSMKKGFSKKSQAGLLKCPWCKHVEKSKEALAKHVNACSKSMRDVFKCTVCPYITLSNKYLKQHYRTAHGIESQTPAMEYTAVSYNCKLCPYVSSRRRYLLCHYTKSHGMDPPEEFKVNKSFECQKCGQTLSSASGLGAHYTGVHLAHFPMDFKVLYRSAKRRAVAGYVCHGCGLQVRSTGQLRVHLDLHRELRRAGASGRAVGPSSQSNRKGASPKPATIPAPAPEKAPPRVEAHACALCGRWFPSRVGLRVHERRSHGAEAAEGGPAPGPATPSTDR